MTTVHHLNCLAIESPGNGFAIGHCLLLEDENRLALVDTGLGLMDTLHPKERIGQDLIDIVGFKFNENQTAIRQIEQLGFLSSQVEHCILTHLDPDHLSGVIDFPGASLHVSSEELENFTSNNPRYLQIQLAHQPVIKTYGFKDQYWFGLAARKVDIDFNTDIFLIPLFGHTLGHCGVAIKQEKKWLFHIGDAYYLRAEIDATEHPVTQLAMARADDNRLRIESLNKIKDVMKDHGDHVEIFGYHDPVEFKG